METVEYICRKYNIDLNKNSPFEIPCGRWGELPKLFKDLDFKIGAEIGVLKGEWSENLFKFIPNLKMFCIDKWLRYPGPTMWRQERLDRYEKEARRRLENHNCKIIKKWSMDAVKDFKNGSLDFIYIDANHTFQFVTNDIAEWSKKVRKGGIISGHDFYTKKIGHNLIVHVEDVVRAWTYLYDIHPWFVLRDNDLTSKSVSWMWIKE